MGGAGDNLGNHLATQDLNLAGNNLTGSGASITGIGLGVRADGGLNIGQNTTGNNVYLGYQNGAATSSGTNNTCLGFGSNVNATNLSNATAIGSGAIANASNKMRLGNSNVTVIEGTVAFTTPSDARFKYQVQANVPGLAFIRQLRPVTYRFDGAKLDAFERSGVLPAGFTPDSTAAIQTGFLAQEVERAARAVGFVFDGVHAPANARDHYAVAYSQFVVPLVQAVQEQQTQIEALQAANAALQAENAALRAQTTTDHADVQTLKAQMTRLLSEDAEARK